MTLAQALLPEFDHENANTRKCLSRITDDILGWRVHAKSWTIGELATHLANLPSWTVPTINDDSFDFAPPGGEPLREEPVDSVADALEMFDRNTAAARGAIAGANDETMLAPWSLLNGGEVMFTMPRLAVLRSFLMNHLVHHRGQLTVYLRLNDIAVPALYGPSADEAG